jgi:F-box-like
MQHHRCLEIEEILCNVFKTIESSNSLAALARTCKSFTNPALDLLWYRLWSLEPLLKTLPSTAFVIRAEGKPETWVYTSVGALVSLVFRLVGFFPTLTYIDLAHHSSETFCLRIMRDLSFIDIVSRKWVCDHRVNIPIP